MTSENRLRSKPVFIISFILMYPLANRIALGGVETGIIKAQLAANVTGMASNMGLM